MESTVLRDVLQSWDGYGLDDDIYIRSGAPRDLATEVMIFPFDRVRPRIFGSWEYLLSFEQVRDVIEGLERQLGRSTSLEERAAAVLHYAEQDAFIEPEDLP